MASSNAQDLEILKGYVPGFNGVLGHECVATVVESPSQPDLVGEPGNKLLEGHRQGRGLSSMEGPLVCSFTVSIGERGRLAAQELDAKGRN